MMSVNFYILLLLVTFLLFVSGCQNAAAPVSVSNRPVSINDRPATNLPMPPSKPFTEMSWTDDNAKVQKLGDLSGKAVILDFWATNCPPCKAEIPHLNSLIAKYGADNLHIVGMHVGDSSDRANIPNFVKSTKLDYPIAYPEKELERFIFAERDDIPQTAIFDRKGRLVKKIVGFEPTRIQPELDAAVEEAVNSN